ncbi:hypothetical protein [Corynebacterium sp.]|uniref:hypothetical protein n=1 Tax=Corynebacterium sp. TaxID=1720 RepID=UPI0026DA7E8D|nr:hypothetical protein [Corynebacterium sp.]MDO5077729.1 hypothetical protein [Corynebacterium sp.]
MTNPFEGIANRFGSSENTGSSGNPEPAAPAPAPEAPVSEAATPEAHAEGASGQPQDEIRVEDPSGRVQNHVSSRDVDADGSIDVVHSVEDGTQNINYLSAEGEVILTDVDADHDGTFETARITTADNVIASGTDLDNDGDVDLVSYADGRSGVIFQEDSIEDGVVTSSRIDVDGDGMTDIELVDENMDGHFEKAGADFDMDGDADVVYRDVNNDGNFDYASYDSNNDGVMDTNLDSNDYGGTGLGDAEDFAEIAHYESDESASTFDFGGDDMGDPTVGI